MLDTTRTTSPAATRKRDKRPTLTLKGQPFTSEFRALINKAAERQGTSMVQWVADTLTREAQRVVTGAPDPFAGPPAVADHEARARLDLLETQVATLAAPRRRWWRRAATV